MVSRMMVSNKRMRNTMSDMTKYRANERQKGSAKFTFLLLSMHHWNVTESRPMINPISLTFFAIRCVTKVLMFMLRVK